MKHGGETVSIQFRPNFLAGVVVGAGGLLMLQFAIRHPEFVTAILRKEVTQ